MSGTTDKKLAPHERKRKTLKELRAARIAMSEFKFTDALRSESDSVKTQAALTKLNVIAAIRDLENAELANIRDELIAMGGDLDAATKAMQASLKALEQTRQVLATVQSVLSLVARLVPLLLV